MERHEPYLCIKPACGEQCSGCNGALSPQTVREYAIAHAAALAQPQPDKGVADEMLVLLIEHDGDDSPSVALARNREELLSQVKCAVWGEPNPDDTTNDAGDDMAEGMTDTLLETGAMHFEGDKPLRLVRIPAREWFTAPQPADAQAVAREGLATETCLLIDALLEAWEVSSGNHPSEESFNRANTPEKRERRIKARTELEAFIDRLAAAAKPAPASAQEWSDEQIDVVARAIYAQWGTQAGYVPWVDGGNSARQDDARIVARGVLSKLAPQAVAAGAPTNLLIAVAALLGGFVEDGTPITRGEARDMLTRVRKATNLREAAPGAQGGRA